MGTMWCSNTFLQIVSMEKFALVLEQFTELQTFQWVLRKEQYSTHISVYNLGGLKVIQYLTDIYS